MAKHVSSPKKKFEKFSDIRNLHFDLNKTVSKVTEEEEGSVSPLEIIKIATAFALLLLVSFFRLEGIVRLIAFLIPFFVISFDVIVSVLKKIQKGNIADDSLIILAASVLCFLIGKYTEAVVLVILYRLVLLGLNVLAQRQRKQREELRPDARTNALLSTSIGTIRSDLKKLQPEDVLILRSGERLPADGILMDGDCSMDVSFLMGETTVQSFHAGEFVPAGSVSCAQENVKIQLVSTASGSFWEGLQDRVDHADVRASAFEKKLKSAFHILDLARGPAALLLIVLGGAVSGNWSEWISRGIILLVCTATFPVKKILSILYREAVCRGAGQGIFLKSNETVEKLENARTFVFEKNGVISTGKYEIRDMKAFGISEKELFGTIAKAQIHASSQVSYAFKALFDDASLGRYTMDHFQEFPGRGVSAVINGHRCYVGNASFVSAYCVFDAQPTGSGVSVHLARDGAYAGYVTLGDRIKEGVFDALEKLRANQVNSLVLLTEDSAVTSRKIASALNFDLIRAEITPEDKCNSLAYLIKNKQKGSEVAFVGTCLSYGELYTTADVGVMLHSLKEHPMNREADVLLFHPAVSKIADAVGLCTAAMRKNRILTAAGLGASGLLLLLGLFGATGLLATLILLGLAVLGEVLFTVFYR